MEAGNFAEPLTVQNFASRTRRKRNPRTRRRLNNSKYRQRLWLLYTYEKELKATDILDILRDEFSFDLSISMLKKDIMELKLKRYKIQQPSDESSPQEVRNKIDENSSIMQEPDGDILEGIITPAALPDPVPQYIEDFLWGMSAAEPAAHDDAGSPTESSFFSDSLTDISNDIHEDPFNGMIVVYSST